ncbi:hypothetical protein [Acidithiobacillus sp.]|uniref:hypothetical protein n=1 Tax=Acidithiobacillus sp. TaxID=1872118 RepID=UPI003D02C26E
MYNGTRITTSPHFWDCRFPQQRVLQANMTAILQFREFFMTLVLAALGLLLVCGLWLQALRCANDGCLHWAPIE